MDQELRARVQSRNGNPRASRELASLEDAGRPLRVMLCQLEPRPPEDGRGPFFSWPRLSTFAPRTPRVAEETKAPLWPRSRAKIGALANHRQTDKGHLEGLPCLQGCSVRQNTPARCHQPEAAATGFRFARLTARRVASANSESNGSHKGEVTAFLLKLKASSIPSGNCLGGGGRGWGGRTPPDELGCVRCCPPRGWSPHCQLGTCFHPTGLTSCAFCIHILISLHSEITVTSASR